MKASDLRIGNLIYSKYHKSEDEIIGVNGYWVKISLNPLADYKFEDVEPIPLTEEWLLKAGFKVDDSAPYLGCVYKRDDFPYISADFDVLVSSYCIAELEYVHQLQNLYFALTGNELEFKP